VAAHLYGRPGRNQKAFRELNFRLYRPNLGSPESQNFYHGQACHLGHTLRDKDRHWCHDCAHRITANIVGLDVSFLMPIYRDRTMAVINMLKETLDDGLTPGDCWDVGSAAKLRFCFPSYQSALTDRVNDQVGIKKIIYQLFWGDIGHLYVTRNKRVCSNENCVNPLHLVTTLNQAQMRPPKMFHYLDLNVSPQKILIMDRRHLQNLSIDDILKKVYKTTIRDPKMDR
jgi:hypothetical protein